MIELITRVLNMSPAVRIKRVLNRLPDFEHVTWVVQYISRSPDDLKVPKHEIFDFVFFASKECIWPPVT
jgi:hypothetical protein